MRDQGRTPKKRGAPMPSRNSNTHSSTAGLMSALCVAGSLGKPFRPEIEGLRAAAVGAVVLFHSGFGVVSGGFLGVDVFFVISGFLITRNIVYEMEGNEFRLSYFYWRRILRLFPASATTILATLLAGFVLLPPEEVKQLAHSAISAIFAVSNIYFWMHVGYFDTDAHLKPLLHTWSLGVEEQFYLVWAPSLAVGLRFIRRRGMLWLILAAAAASLMGATIVLDHDPSAAFYLAPFQIFEFAAGIWLALVDPEGPRNRALRTAIFLAGLVAVLCSFLLLDGSAPIPGPVALLPCLGTAAVIYAGAEQPAEIVLTNPAMQIRRANILLSISHALARRRLHRDRDRLAEANGFDGQLPDRGSPILLGRRPDAAQGERPRAHSAFDRIRCLPRARPLYR